jgi:mannose-6-phosphate isomerase-like protein (cupin superfamily)
MEITKTCKYCNQEYKVSDDKNLSLESQYCTKEHEELGKQDIQNNKPYYKSLCVICNKEFSHTGEKVTCSNGCRIDYILKSALFKNSTTNIQSNSLFAQLITPILSSHSKIVQKGWGFEVHITNNPQYCLKYLVFFKGKKFSLHYHSIKKELWHCIVGKFDCILSTCTQKNVRDFTFKSGDKLEITQNIEHQLFALENSIIVEVSTEDYPEDSIRITKGD